jgi:acyl-CoA synthetase (AMP-forming)/AMP-acid ligase II/acyl carrier protein
MDKKAYSAGMVPESDCISDLLRGRSQASPASIALMRVDGDFLTYESLYDVLKQVAHQLGEFGLGRNDRIALVLPDGLEMAAAFLAITGCATCAPLNPAYRNEDFEFYLSDLDARALVLMAGQDSPSRAVAQARGIPVLEIQPRERGGGAFGLIATDSHLPQRAAVEFSQPDDVALVLHTSGTTSRPKLVPLTHRNLSASARHIVSTLNLTPVDRCLNIMPLFHIHGLIGATLSSITVGASVICTPGFLIGQFFKWVDYFRPTWYTAVPTMHQAILAQASENASIIDTCPFRFIRSSSSALPPSVMLEMERVFSAPVIESYGMTEASHQVASNPLPPKTRKPGSVGPAAGPEVAIIAENGDQLDAGNGGEIGIQGPNITGGYENNPQANAAGFVKGWFRTGDQGYLDQDGYLFITGRIKELINRGGEKIAPREIDEVLMAHPKVQQAVAFAVPHPSLGEDIAMAVVPKAGCQLEETELRQFVAGRLPQFKVPSRIVLVSDIPKGSTGKIQRIGLADQLASKLAADYEPPASYAEELVASIFAQVLSRDIVGRYDNFFALGGDSIGATQVASRLREALGMEIAISVLFQSPTPAMLGREIERLNAEQGTDGLAVELEKLSPEELSRILNRSPESEH